MHDNKGLKDTSPAPNGLEKFLDKKSAEVIERYIEQDAKKPDGSIDVPLAQRIRWEVSRRAETGKQLDIYEPLRWTGVRTLLGIIGAGVAKMVTDRVSGKSKTIAFGVEIGIIVTTVINSLIDLTRLYPRWLAGLKGGKNTALRLHHRLEALPEEQISSPTPAIELNATVGNHAIHKKPPIQPTSFVDHAKPTENSLCKSL
jgi:hypothetical protein